MSLWSQLNERSLLLLCGRKKIKRTLIAEDAVPQKRGQVRHRRACPGVAPAASGRDRSELCYVTSCDFPRRDKLQFEDQQTLTVFAAVAVEAFSAVAGERVPLTDASTPVQAGLARANRLLACGDKMTTSIKKSATRDRTRKTSFFIALRRCVRRIEASWWSCSGISRRCYFIVSEK